MFSWFDTRPSVQFARDLAQDLLKTLVSSTEARDAKFKVKAEKALIRADARVREFRRVHAMNFYKRSKLANTFLWTLRDGGCPADYATELTEWLTYRL
jgi:hypothetical protein